MINDFKPYLLIINSDSKEVLILTKEEWIANANSNLDEISQYDTLLNANSGGILYSRGNNLKFKRRC